ncbi:MAG: isochorismatase family protein [Candidatus Kapaibacterium sp.]
MKEVYFTQENITIKSAEMLDELSIYAGHRTHPPITRSTALMVLDLQNFFTRGDSHAFVPSATAIMNNINELIHLFDNNNLPVIYTYHTNSADNAGLMDRWWRDMIASDSVNAGIDDRIIISDNSKIYEKHQYSAFSNPELNEYLISKNIDTLVITGVMTHLCCDTTARDAFMRGFRPIIPIDATATYSEKLHLSSMRCLAHGIAQITNTKRFIDQIYEE